MIREHLERQRIKKVLGQVVDPESVESLLREDQLSRPLEHRRIEFVLAFIRGESPTQVSERIARGADLAVTHGATVHDLVSGLMIVTFDSQPSPLPGSGNRLSLIQGLREQLGYDVKIVHGAAEGHYGLFGSATRMSYSFLVPMFDSILGVLSRLEFGQTVEFRQ